MRAVAFDHFYSYDELSETLRTWADEVPRLCSVESIGTSYEGRDIWLVTVTNTETGDQLDKPGFLIEANIHAMEWTGSAAALREPPSVCSSAQDLERPEVRVGGQNADDGHGLAVVIVGDLASQFADALLNVIGRKKDLHAPGASVLGLASSY